MIVHLKITIQMRLAFQKMEKSVIANLETEKENEKQARDKTQTRDRRFKSLTYVLGGTTF